MALVLKPLPYVVSRYYLKDLNDIVIAQEGLRLGLSWQYRARGFWKDLQNCPGLVKYSVAHLLGGFFFLPAFTHLPSFLSVRKGYRKR